MTQMKLLELIVGPAPDAEREKGAKIPWNDPEFSRRMLECHLDQNHDWASRRKETIAAHTAWIAAQLNRAPSSILDMGCGPGLYTQSLAAMGHHCTGVDFSPASIAYARQLAARGPEIEYALRDIREYRSERQFDCVLMTFGEFNVFTRQDATAILGNCSGMLRTGGLFVLEAHAYEAIRAIGSAPASWQRHTRGVFSETPYLCLQENSWDASSASALSRYFIIDAVSATVRRYASFMQAYTATEYYAILREAKLPVQRILDADAWPPGADFSGALQVFACRKGA